MTDCPFCNETGAKVLERNEVDHFQYGVDGDSVMLSADVIVQYCDTCKEEWTDWRSEDTRQEAVETHLEGIT